MLRATRGRLFCGNPGLSAWIRGGAGRDSLGFGADSAGASSFVVAFNSAQLRFQNNNGHDFNTTTVKSLALLGEIWCLASIHFGSSIVGSLYDSDGTTLLASPPATGLDMAPPVAARRVAFPTSMSTRSA
jgi:hypothetical protein